MADSKPQRDLWSLILFSVLLLLGLATLGLGVLVAVTQQDYVLLGLGVVAVAVPASAAAIGQKLSVGGTGGRAEQVGLLRAISQRVELSDLQRRMVDRQRDRQSLRQAIQEDIEKQDYEAALALVDEMADQFGYIEESEKYRQQIIDARARQREELIVKSVEHIHDVCARYDWPRAAREVDRLRRLFPEDARIAALPRHVEQARDDHKRELEREFLRAAEVSDNEKAMALLKELDTYLTPQEAEAYLETARGVVGQARENTAVRFRMAVSDRDWIEAVNVGEQIIRDFPNSKMANEARDMMDVLRERAAGQRAADAGRMI